MLPAFRAPRTIARIMKQLSADEIRRTWLDFFEARGHTRVKSASLVPDNDPTLLFTGAGMNPFKDLFLGRGEKPYSRATSVQKCFRTGDLEEVGRTTYHHTFFEMLGNFSFGDYFKREAILWAWEFLTVVLEMPADRLSATIYQDDDEAYEIWSREVGLPDSRLTRLGAKSNFWPSNAPLAGPNGVCGPCSEIFWDYGEEYSCGPDCAREDCDCPRYSEIWNLVFTQFLRTGKGRLEPLPQKNIDTGAGFERFVAVVRGELSTFGTELFTPILARISDLTGIEYEFATEAGVRMRRIADHVRAAAFCLSDGVKPGRDGREFVLRRVIRRAVRDGITLGLEQPFLTKVSPVVADVMGESYPEIRQGLDDLNRLLGREEERFRATYHQGMNALEQAVADLKTAGKDVLGGDQAFKLHDERGFPVDLTEDYLREQGLRLDREGFEAAMDARRRESQDGARLEADIFARGPIAEVRNDYGVTRFTGYETTADRGRIVAIVVDEERVDEAGAGAEVTVIADPTPFYAESGGQVGDHGEIRGPAGRMTVTDTHSAEGVTYMSGRIAQGRLAVDEEAELVVDEARRNAIRRNHTATHLLHRALKNRLGEGATQAGSLVAPDRLRFDFHHEGGMSDEEIRDVEAEVNREILANTGLASDVTDIATARAEGAVAMFGEKYGDRVRVVTVGGYSKELCGGTHCAATGDIGSFRIVSESNIGAGLRRIEAVTGEGALDLMRSERALVRELTGALKTRPNRRAPGRDPGASKAPGRGVGHGRRSRARGTVGDAPERGGAPAAHLPRTLRDEAPPRRRGLDPRQGREGRGPPERPGRGRFAARDHRDEGGRQGRLPGGRRGEAGGGPPRRRRRGAARPRAREGDGRREDGGSDRVPARARGSDPLTAGPRGARLS